MTCLEWSQSSWGLPVCEAEAIKAFRNLTQKTVYETRIWLDSSEILGSSSDGIPDIAALCLGSQVSIDRGEYDNWRSSKHLFIICLEKTEVASPLENGHVNWKVQGEIYFLHRQFCSFEWTTKDIVVLKIARDDTWAENFRKLTLFYLMHPFPKVVEG